MMRLMVFGATAALIAGCSPVLDEVAGMQEATAEEVSGCTYVGKVEGILGMFGPLRDVAIRDAKRSAKERAKQEGGNTIVFDPITPETNPYVIPAQVYLC